MFFFNIDGVSFTIYFMILQHFKHFIIWSFSLAALIFSFFGEASTIQIIHLFEISFSTSGTALVYCSQMRAMQPWLFIATCICPQKVVYFEIYFIGSKATNQKQEKIFSTFSCLN